MALVDYASSSEDEDNVSDDVVSVSKMQPSNALKRKKEAEQELPPLPAKFHDLYASNVRTTTYDDPSLHGGRKRIKPHVEGNWPTHVYVEWWPRSRDIDTLSKLIKSFSALTSTADSKIESLLESELGAPLPLHISLSRSLTLTLSNKTSFLAKVQNAVLASSISSFSVNPTSCTWVSNYERTRWFLVLSLARPEGDQLNDLLRLCSKIATDYDQPRLYDSPNFEAARSAPELADEFDRSLAFHISIAWTLIPPSQALIEAATTWSNDSIDAFTVEGIKVRIGNVVTSVPLKAKIKPLFNV